jgi:four helix bundle protein
MRDFRKLRVWHSAHDLTLAIYRSTRNFPKDELYGLTSQLRRASTSIGANIAEACGRGGRLEFARFLRIAMGSASEVEYHLLLSADLKLIEPEIHRRLHASVTQIKRMIACLLRKLTAES